MSGKKFLVIYIPLMALGFFGVWLGFRTREPSDPKLWLGPLIITGVVVGLLVAFRRDLREPESERRVEWERAKVRGRLNYVLGQIGLGMLVWGVSVLLSVSFELYRNGGGGAAVMRHISEQAVVGVLVAAICCVWALASWHWQEKKYKQVI